MCLHVNFGHNMNGRTSRVWDSMLVRKSGCVRRSWVRAPARPKVRRFSSYQETGKIFSPEMSFYSKLIK